MTRLAVVSSVVVSLMLVACAEKTPPPQKPAAVAAPVQSAVTTAGPPVEMWPIAKARPVLLATISVSSVDRLLQNGARLVGQAVPLPMDAAGLRDMLLAQAGLSPAVTANLDFASPAGAAIVAMGPTAPAKNGTVVAVPARGPAEAAKLIEALGKKVMTRGPATLIESGAQGRGWLFQAGRIVVLSDDLDALARGAMLAIEAQRAGAEDITAVLYPDAMARAHGTDVRTAIARALKEFQAAQQAAGQSALGAEHGLESLQEMLGLVADAERVELGLTVDPAKGLLFKGRLFAKPGTKLEGVARDVHPFELDPAVAVAASRFVVGASSVGPFWKGMLGTYRARLAASKEKGAPSALAFYDTYLAEMAGQQSGGAWLSKDSPHMSVLVLAPLKDAAGAAKVAAAAAKLDAAALAAVAHAQLGARDLFDATAKKETVGKLKATHYRVKLRSTTAPESEGIKRLVGTTFDIYWAVSGTRLVITMGRDAKARLAAVGAGKPVALETSGTFAASLAAAKGRDAFYYFDFAAILPLVGALSTEPRMAALARGGSGPIPMIATSGGDGAGKVWSVDLTIPVAAFTSVGTLVAGGMGASK